MSNDVRVNATARVIGVDLDGTMARYHDHFQWFCENIYWPGRRLKPNWDLQDKGDFAKALRLDRATEYQAAKLAYRQGGLKRCIPIYEETRYVTQYIRQMGIQVWVTTTRPYNRLDNIDPDTQYWLSRNMGRVDGVIFGEEKYEDLIDHVGKDRILGIFDDLPENVERAESLGIRAALREGDHNQWWLRNPDISQDIHVYRDTRDMIDITKVWREYPYYGNQ